MENPTINVENPQLEIETPTIPSLVARENQIAQSANREARKKTARRRRAEILESFGYRENSRNQLQEIEYENDESPALDVDEYWSWQNIQRNGKIVGKITVDFVPLDNSPTVPDEVFQQAVRDIVVHQRCEQDAGDILKLPDDEKEALLAHENLLELFDKNRSQAFSQLGERIRDGNIALTRILSKPKNAGIADASWFATLQEAFDV